MGYNPSDYSNIVNNLTEYYGVSSQEVWNIVNEYNIDPSQLADLLPEYGIYQSADGLYRIYNNAGDTVSYVNQTSVPMGTGNAVQEAINSNAQTGTAATVTKVKWAGNSVIDQNGKVRTSPGVTKYTNGSPSGSVMGIVGNVVSGIAAAATGISLGKAIDSRLYNANPTFWNSLGLSTLDPQTWASITSDLGDTGSEGALKTAFNFIFGIDSDGKTQAYMDADAYNYIAYALAQAGLYDAGETDATKTFYEGYIPHYTQPIPLYTGSIPAPYYNSDNYHYIHNLPSGVYAATVQTPTTYECYAISQQPFTYDMVEIRKSDGHETTTQISSLSSNGNYDGTIYNYYYRQLFSVNKAYVVPESNNYSYCNQIGTQYLFELWIVTFLGQIHTTSPLPGVTDQSGATVPTGIDSNSTQQEVTNAIAQQYPDLENNRIEQTVVQPDGTTIIKKYYPIPMPNDVTDTTITEPTPVNIESGVRVVIPVGQTITLPDGRTVTGDGVTPIILPSGEYTLPVNTTITNNYVTNTTNITGGSQASTETDSTSTDTLLQTIINILTSPEPQTLSDTSAEDATSTETTTDTGEGNTPPTVIPVGSASALWSVYNPTLAQLNSLGAWLWSSDFVDQLLKMFSDPMQSIIGLHKTYIQPSTGATRNIVVGYLDSGVRCLTVPTQYSSMDCGTVNLSEYFGNVFDYSPYTRVFLYLPFIGFKELDVSQVMRSSINVKYYGDAYTGAGLAEVKVTRDAGAGGVLYTFGCDVAAKYPLSSGSYMGIVSGIASIAASATMALGGMMNPIMGLGGIVGSAMGSRTKVEQSGGFSGNSGAMGIKKPYLVIMRPQTAMANNYKHFSGAPSNDNVTIGTASGFIRVRECHVEHISGATDQEKTMIERMLKDGVVV